MYIIKKLLALIFLQSAPQELPYSPTLTVQLAIAYILSGIIVLRITINPDDLVAGIILGFIIQYAFTYLVLRALRREARFMQTFCAIVGVGLVFNIISLPVFEIVADETASDALKSSISLVFLMMISWEVLVKAYIFRHALEMKMVGALALSFSLFFISVALSQLLFPAEGAS